MRQAATHLFALQEDFSKARICLPLLLPFPYFMSLYDYFNISLLYFQTSEGLVSEDMAPSYCSDPIYLRYSFA